MIQIYPIQDCLIIEREAPEKVAGKIIIPETAQHLPLVGRVLAVGPGKQLADGTVVPTSLAVGDRVMFERYMGTETESGGKAVLVIREQFIIAVLEGDGVVEIPLPKPPPGDQVIGANDAPMDYAAG